VTTTTENGLTIIRHETDRMTSVYRGREYLGSALPWLASDTAHDWIAAGPLKDHSTLPNEKAAIEYLAGEG
jgi:hypothetical protein